MTEEEKKQWALFCEILRDLPPAHELGGELFRDWVASVRKTMPAVHNALQKELSERTAPIPMLLWCPECGERHIDEGAFGGPIRHHTHACQFCGMVWRPSLEHTVGVQFLPGYKNP